MRLIHLSDTHLGRAEYSAYDPDLQINQREADIYRAFGEVVDYIVAAKPDMVIHAGDLFDSIRPPNRAMSEAFRQLHRLSAARIPTVIVAGNHSTPRDRSAGTIFDLFRYIPHIRPVYGGKYEKIEIGDAAVHAIPHTYSDADLADSIKRLAPDGSRKYNVMVTHAAIRGTDEASWGEFKEQVIPPDALDPAFDYIALGHYHKHLRVADNAYYSGSPERMSIREARDTKGFLDVRLGRLPPEHVPTHARKTIDLDPIDCAGAGADDIVRALEAALPPDLSGAVLRVTLDGIEDHVHAALDRRRMRDLVSMCAHCEFNYKWKPRDPRGASKSTAIGSLGDEFRAFVGRSAPGTSAKSLLKKGEEYLSKASNPEVA